MINFQLGEQIVKGEGNALYTYRIASNGIFLEAERPEVKVRFQIAACELRGAGEALDDMFDWNLPRLNEAALLATMRVVQREASQQREVALWMIPLPDNGWHIIRPKQEQAYASCKPFPDQRDFDQTIIELHSHHVMPARFSTTDDRDETGFRIYSVVGNLGDQPTIRTRVGVFGQFWEIPSMWVYELPEGLTDAIA